MSRDFEIVKSQRGLPSETPPETPEIIVPSRSQRIGEVVANNFDHILDLASNIVEIQKMKVQSEAIISQMRESREQLMAEAKAYAIKKNADTNDKIQKMQLIRQMMCDFYQNSNNSNLSGEEFSRIINSIVSEMGRL